MSDEIKHFFSMATEAIKGGGLTPLQLQEINMARKAHEDCDYVDNADLQKQRADIEKHWQMLNRSLVFRGQVTTALALLGFGFASIVFQEYSKRNPPTRHASILLFAKMLGSASERQEAADQLLEGDVSRLDWLYEETIIRAVNELLLDREHVETRLRNVCIGNDMIKTLLTSGREACLRELIVKDLASLERIASFLPTVGPAHRLCKRDSRVILESTKSHTASKKVRRLWNSLRFELSSIQPRNFSKSLSSAYSPLSDDDPTKSLMAA